MSIQSHQSMINHHGSGFWPRSRRPSSLAGAHGERRELAQWTDRDLHDVGLSRSDVIHETEKPFWRA